MFACLGYIPFHFLLCFLLESSVSKFSIELVGRPSLCLTDAVFAFFLSQSSSLFTYTLYYHGYIKSVITPK